MSTLPADIVLDRKIDLLIENGHPLPRWGWPEPTPYNGATGAERIFVWQKNNIAWRAGLMPQRSVCSVCEVRHADQSHGELYFRPFALMPICRSCHARVHKRFRSPARWGEFLETIKADNWAQILLPEQLSREEAIRLSNEPDWLGALTTFSAAHRADQ